jgi:hypothetical protein
MSDKPVYQAEASAPFCFSMILCSNTARRKIECEMAVKLVSTTLYSIIVF